MKAILIAGLWAALSCGTGSYAVQGGTNKTVKIGYYRSTKGLTLKTGCSTTSGPSNAWKSLWSR